MQKAGGSIPPVPIRAFCGVVQLAGRRSLKSAILVRIQAPQSALPQGNSVVRQSSRSPARGRRCEEVSEDRWQTRIFSSRSSASSCQRPTPSNEAAAPAYRLAPKHALAQYAATGCMNSTFYAGAEEQLAKVLELCETADPAFVARLAVYARERGHMKDVPALLLRRALGARPRAVRASLPARVRQREDAPHLRADRPLGRGGPQVARHAAEADGARRGSTRATRRRSSSRPSASRLRSPTSSRWSTRRPRRRLARRALRLPRRPRRTTASGCRRSCASSRRSRRARRCDVPRVPFQLLTALPLEPRSGPRSRATRRGR